MLNPATLPSNVPRAQPMSSSNGPSVPPVSALINSSSGVQIKPEPSSGYDLQNLPASNGVSPHYGGNPVALQRAAHQLQEKFPASANMQVNQLQQRAAMAQQGAQAQKRSPNMASMSDAQKQQLAEQQRRIVEQQRRDQQAHHLQQAQQRAAVNNTQTDGATDWNAMVAQRRADAQRLQREDYDADLTLRQHVEQMSRAMEGGGLMLPLSELPKQPVPKKRKIATREKVSVLHDSQNVDACGEIASSRLTTPTSLPQLDGPNDSDSDDKAGIKDDPDIDGDEDAINSDLDDPEDNVPDETETDGNNGAIMLCTYDKVQRVKNKWKCTLKDGVLTTNGKEYVSCPFSCVVLRCILMKHRYVFHKAQGEFEW